MKNISYNNIELFTVPKNSFSLATYGVSVIGSNDWSSLADASDSLSEALISASAATPFSGWLMSSKSICEICRI